MYGIALTYRLENGNFKTAQMVEFSFGRAENIVGKGEKAGLTP